MCATCPPAACWYRRRSSSSRRRPACQSLVANAVSVKNTSALVPRERCFSGRGVTCLTEPDIFLSYSREEAGPAKRFAEAFQKEGFDVWWDARLRSGDDFDTVIEEALQSAKAVVVLWSAKSVNSRWVRAEAVQAQHNKTLCPVLIEPCKLPIMFELTQTADLSHWKGKASDKAWRAFVAGLREFIGRDPAGAVADNPISQPGHAHPHGPAVASRKPLLIAALILATLALLGGLYLAFGDRVRGGVSATQPQGRIPLLVRPFAASGSGDANEAALAGGITDELIVRLRRIPNLQVGNAGRDGAAGSGAFAGAYVVDGNIRSSGNQLRVTARLTKADGEILWTDTFDRKIGQLFELQEVIAASIANALSVSLDVGTDSVAYGGTNNPEAYADYMQFKINEFAFDQSVPLGFLKRAIALDPKYLKALSALSNSYSPRIAYASTRQEADRLLAEMDASTASMLAANPHMWMGHVSRAWYYIARKDYTGAKKELDRAQKSDTQTDPELPGQLATLYDCLGYTRKASALVQSAEIIDPLFRNDPRVIRDLLYTGKYQQAIDLFSKLSQDGNSDRLNHTLEALWAYELLGRETEGIALAKQQGTQFGQDVVDFKADKALPTMTMPQLRQWVARKYGDGGHFQLANAAALASYYGHPDLAVNLMRLTLERPGAVGALTMWNPAFANARKTPAFAQLVNDEGFVKMWRESGDWGDFCRPAAGGTITCH